MKAPSLGIDPLVAVVGGGGLFVSGVASLLLPRPYVGQVIGVIGVAAYVVALVVLAIGLPRRPGAVGRGVAVRAALVAAAAVTAIGELASRLVPVDLASFETVRHQVFVALLSAAGLAAPLLLLVAAATVGRSPGATRDARRGLVALAVITFVAYAVPQGLSLLAFGASFSQDSLGIVLGLSLAVHRIAKLLICAVGVWFAWPWLEPHLVRARDAFRRAWHRYVDSTP